MRKVFKIMNSPTRFCSISISECSDQISWETVKSAYPINSFKEKGFSRKPSASFRLLKISKHITPSRRNVSTTEPVSFTVCKLELHGKAIVSQSRSRRDYALYLDEIPRFSSFLVLALFCFLFKDFSPFWSVSWWWKDLVLKAWPRLSVDK